MSREKPSSNESVERPGKTILKVEGLSMSKGIDPILENVGFTILEGDHVALVGPNGAGKTTLLEAVIGEELPDSGKVYMSGGVSVAYVPQSVENIFSENQDRTLIDYFYASRGLDEIKKRMEEIEILLGGDTDQTENLLEEYGSLQAVFEHKGGYSIETEAVTMMAGVGLDKFGLDTSVYDLSGGEKTKLFLAQALLSNADLLLLDEPSNHLDPESVSWLGDFLKKYKGTVLVISHHLDLLDQTVGRVLELNNRELRAYQGNYSDYIEQKKKREAIETRHAKRSQEEIERLSEMVDRFRAGVRAKTAKDRQKKLDKIKETAPKKKAKQRAIRASFEVETQSGLSVLEVSDLKKVYGEKVIDYSGMELKIERGEKVGIIGPIGAGKSTLLKMVAGVISPDHGEIVFGYKVDMGYYSQEMEDLDPKNTVLEEIESVSTGESVQKLRSFLGSFLFSNDDVFKKAGVLSFGERSRLMLAKLALRKHNFLVLDEPSNHLDLVTKNLIADKLREYEGALLLVSHDEEFMNRVGLNKKLNLSDHLP